MNGLNTYSNFSLSKVRRANPAKHLSMHLKTWWIRSKSLFILILSSITSANFRPWFIWLFTCYSWSLPSAGLDTAHFCIQQDSQEYFEVLQRLCWDFVCFKRGKKETKTYFLRIPSKQEHRPKVFGHLCCHLLNKALTATKHHEALLSGFLLWLGEVNVLFLPGPCCWLWVMQNSVP